jgi:hypothetical protein
MSQPEFNAVIEIWLAAGNNPERQSPGARKNGSGPAHEFREKTNIKKCPNTLEFSFE